MLCIAAEANLKQRAGLTVIDSHRLSNSTIQVQWGSTTTSSQMLGSWFQCMSPLALASVNLA